MSELSFQRRARVERVLVLRQRRASQQREVTASQKLDGVLVLMAFGLAILILATLFIWNAEWSPGNQEAIAAEYRALRHNAVAVEEWK